MENQPAQPAPSNAGQTMGIVALILGIISLPLAFIPCVGFLAIPPACLAIIFGIIGIVQANKVGGKKGLPMAGLIIGIVALVIIVAWMVMFAEVANVAKEAIEQDSTFMQGLDSALMQMDTVKMDSIK